MAFKRPSGTTWVPSDPVQLYRKLAETNDGPESLWFHQGTVLLDWHKNHSGEKSTDVAIELPTGAGKTLVGGLIGDFRRRVAGERVVYLCPTRQLARQTAAKLTEYGIANVLLIGKVKEWNLADRIRYTTGAAIAVSVYSHVFNSNPALGEAQLLLLDDAHAADSAVASPWSLEIDRGAQASAYLDVLSALTDALDPPMLEWLRTDTPDGQFRNTVHLASPLGVAAQAAHLEQVLTAAHGAGKLGEEAGYALRFLSGHLDQCLVYLSRRSLLIRPLIPPTMAHPAFDNPAHRVYMSATLGAGGELERIFGRRKITRIAIPEGWEKQGTGRRFFCFPQLTNDLAADPEAADKWVAGVIARHGRAVVLTPDARTAEKFIETRLPEGVEVLKAKSVEDDLTVFTDKPAAALVLTNRYDGIDLPDEDCRLVVLAGLPARGDLQERFLFGSLGAVDVLQERIRARITQGAGRATRNSKDFATVLVLDDDLLSYITRGDVLRAMHPEVHAELEFGYTYSLGTTSAEMLENLDVFIEHGEEWHEVDQSIVDARETYKRENSPGTVELQRAVIHEVAACEAIWQGDWVRALELIRQVLDALRGGKASQRYAALWHYLAHCIARRLAQQTDDHSLVEAAAKSYRDARVAGRGTTWLTHLVAPAEGRSVTATSEIDPLDAQAMNGVLANAATRLGYAAVFDEALAKARSALQDSPAKPYEAAVVTMGQLAGAVPSEGDGGSDSAPDATWIFGDVTWVSWETKSEAKPDGELGAGDVRQAGSHLRFIADKRAEAAPGDSLAVLVTPKSRIHPSARAVAEDHVYLVRPDQVLDLFDRLERAWRAMRTRDLDSLSSTDLVTIFSAEGALPTQWIPRLRAEPLQRNAEAVAATG